MGAGEALGRVGYGSDPNATRGSRRYEWGEKPGRFGLWARGFSLANGPGGRDLGFSSTACTLGSQGSPADFVRSFYGMQRSE